MGPVRHPAFHLLGTKTSFPLPIRPENAKRLASDASILTVLEDKHGNVMYMGRKLRSVSPKQKMGLDIRDETCRFPGCNCKKYVDYHHILFWGHDGFTDHDNLIKLCRFHHTLLHLGIYTIELREQTDDNHQKWIFKNPEGLVIEPSPRLPPAGQDYKDSLPPIPKKLPRALKRMFDYQYTKKMLDE